MENIRILVIDGNTPFTENLNDALEKMGYSVVKAMSSDRKILHAIQKNQPDLVICTVDDEEASRNLPPLHQIQEIAHCPLIYLVGQPSDSLFQRLKKSRPVNFLFHPLNLQELEISIELALANQF